MFHKPRWPTRPAPVRRSQIHRAAAALEAADRAQVAQGARKARPPRRAARQLELSQKVAVQFQLDHPNAFPGDSLDFLRCIYKNPDLDLAVRMDAAGRAARFERPTLAAIAVQQPPRQRLDVSALSRAERETLLPLLQKAWAWFRLNPRSKHLMTDDDLLSPEILENVYAALQVLA